MNWVCSKHCKKSQKELVIVRYKSGRFCLTQSVNFDAKWASEYLAIEELTNSRKIRT